MFNTEIEKGEYFDLELTDDCQRYIRNYNDYKLISVDVTKSLNSTGTTQQNTDVILKNISLTGYDNFFIDLGLKNGRIDTNTQYIVDSGDTFSFHTVSGYTHHYRYNISGATLNGQPYRKLNGGFYQGLFKLYGYPVEFVPKRQEKGWTINTLLNFKINHVTGVTTGRTINYSVGYVTGVTTGSTQHTTSQNTLLSSGYTTGSTTQLNLLGIIDLAKVSVSGLTTTETNTTYTGITYSYPSGYTYNTGITTMHTLNQIYPNNSGFIFYIGTRSENKYSDKTMVEIANMNKYYDINIVNTDHLYTVDPIFLLDGNPYSGYYNIYNGLYYTGRNYDSYSVLLQRNPDYKDIIDNSFGVRILSNGRIGYRTIYPTDSCYTGATQDVNSINNNSFIDYTTECDTSVTIKKIITKLFTVEEVMGKYPVIDTTLNKFLYISTVFERDYNYSGCMLTYGEYKNGTLSIYIDGTLVFRYKKCREVTPHELDTDYKFQEGVPFNISFGGGTQGLLEAIYFDPSKRVSGILEKFFAGTFEGGVRLFEMYSTPLNLTEIRTNVDNIKSQYGLYTISGGRQINLKNLF